MIQVFAIPIYDDNYVWVVLQNQACWIIDPGDAQPVANVLSERGLTPKSIWVTHRHWDHITGIEALTQSYAMPVFGPQLLYPNTVTHPVQPGDNLPLAPTQTQVLGLAGHTTEHLGYYLPERQWLFSGDTLFNAGCGRLFDGSIEQLYQAIQVINALPDSTLIFATHEYTLANLKFAQAVEPDNPALAIAVAQSEAQRQKRLPTLPTSLAVQRKINPFLRPHIATVKRRVEAQMGCLCQTEKDVFKHLRRWKDQF